MLAEYDVAWFEEPLNPDALKDYVSLRRAAPVPIASDEVLTRRQYFQPWVKAGAVDIVQPDVTKVGAMASALFLMVGTRTSAWQPTCNWLPRSLERTWWST